MSDPTDGSGQLPTGWASGRAGRDDPGALAKADVRAILAKALGLRRIVELAAEIGASAAEAAPADPPRVRHRRPGPAQPG